MVGLYFFLMTLFLIVCLFMIMLILIQKGRGGGLAGAFGGGGGNTAFGSKTGDVLTWATSIVFGIFLLLAIFLNLVANKIGTPTRAVPPPAATPASPAGAMGGSDLPPPGPSPMSSGAVPTTQP